MTKTSSTSWENIPEYQKGKTNLNINITLLSVQITTVPTAKGSYQVADVAYKNNTFQGKVEGKKVMSFGATAESFKSLAQAQPGQTYEVQIVKNDKGYNDWVSMAAAGAASASAPQKASPSSATPAPKNTYETPEERAKRQISIVRQSSLSNAIATLSVGAKKVEPDDVIAVAKKYESFVNGTVDVAVAGGLTGFDDVPNFDSSFEPS